MQNQEQQSIKATLVTTMTTQTTRQNHNQQLLQQIHSTPQKQFVQQSVQARNQSPSVRNDNLSLTPSTHINRTQKTYPQPQQKKCTYQLKDTMKEYVLPDFIAIRVKPDIQQLEYALKHTLPDLFFGLTYSAVHFTPEQYEYMISKIRDVNTPNRKNIINIARKMNIILRATDFETLKNIEPYKYLDKIQPPQNKNEENEAVQEIQSIICPQYLALIQKIDIDNKYYDKFIQNGWIKQDTVPHRAL